MTDRIFKYNLETGKTEIEMPIGTEILTAQIQGDNAVLWARVPINEDPKRRKRTIHIIATGQQTDFPNSEMKYISTIQTETGFVFHIFEEITIERMST